MKSSPKKTNNSVIKTYILLTKPGIIMGNLITAAAGFFLASRGHIHWTIFGGLMIGIAFIIGSSCVINNFLDREIDEKMERTRNRPSVTGAISVRNAMIYATVLGLIGFLILYTFTNFLTVLMGGVGVIFYVVMYSIWKRRSMYSTIIGSVSGAVPPLAGYTAVTNHIDLGAILLFLILVFWQMPHFYAIGIYRLKDYAAAKIPILPVKRGVRETKIHIIVFIVIFVFMSCLLTFFRYTGYIYLGLAVLLGLRWLQIAATGFRVNDDKLWARKVFKFSLILITVLCIGMSIDFVR